MAQHLSGLDEPDPWVLWGPAAMMADEEEWAIFRRFDEFNLLNLLILQDCVGRLSKEFKALFPDKTTEPGLQPSWYATTSPLGGLNANAGLTEADREKEEKRKAKWNQLRAKLGEYNNALIEMCQLRSLGPPSPESVHRLRKELQNMSAQSLLPSVSTECWDAVNDDDLVVVRSGVGKGNQLNVWLKLGLEMFKWELWGRKKATTAPTLGESRVLSLGKKGKHVSKTEMARKQAFFSRFAMALFGGIALIVPTVIMAKVEGINISLIITSAAVLLFGLALAFGATDSTGKDVLAATAAYTAVLVVFVGTSLAGGNESVVPGSSSNATVS